MMTFITTANDNVLRIHYPSIVDKTVLLTIAEQLKDLCDRASGKTLHVIHDTCAIEEITSPRPQLVALLCQMSSCPQLGWHILYNRRDDEFVQLLTTMVATQMRFQYRVVATTEEAMAFLCNIEGSYPDYDHFKKLMPSRITTAVG